jgi:hypothetical protein
MATFLAANLGELPGHGPIENDMAFAHQGVFTVSPRLKIGLAWQIVSAGNFTIIDKNGGTTEHFYLHRVCSATEAGGCYSR